MGRKEDKRKMTEKLEAKRARMERCEVEWSEVCVKEADLRLPSSPPSLNKKLYLTSRPRSDRDSNLVLPVISRPVQHERDALNLSATEAVSTTDYEHSGINPDSEHSGLNPDSEHSGLSPYLEHSGLDPVSKHSGLNPDSEHYGPCPYFEHSGLNSYSEHSWLSPYSEHIVLIHTLEILGSVLILNIPN
uniref:Uncharacterized protein n=1 Tax=Timema tahoe TaxID=61484 RepID=A0A7R9FKY4_9NEOP|nr:unnamed protein product [Timema tahoe]